jgi:replication factor C subunit 3/5
MTDLPPQQEDTGVVPAPKSTSTRPWVEMHRPNMLSDVVAHEDIINTLRRLMSSNSLPHLLLYGSPGTGKTSTIQACCRELYGNKNLKTNVLELNASDDRGIDVVRNVIKDFASTGQIFFSKPAATATAGDQQQQPQNSDAAVVGNRPAFKMVILDEADQMSSEAQAALRRVIEQYTRNVRFCILCNHVNKIIPAVQSRCTRFRFAPVNKKQMMPRLELICKAENAPFNEAGLAAGGDMRRCVNMLQASHLAFGNIYEESVYRAAGYPTPQEVHTITTLMMTKDFVDAHAEVAKMLRLRGLAVTDLVKEIHTLTLKMNCPENMKCFMFSEMADLEYNLSVGASESIALSTLCGIFQIVRCAVAKHKGSAVSQN